MRIRPLWLTMSSRESIFLHNFYKDFTVVWQLQIWQAQSDSMLRKKSIQVLTVVAALVLLSVYVVYSQLKQAPTVASSSKTRVLTNAGAWGSVQKTNLSEAKPDSGSKSNNTIRLTSPGTNPPGPPARSGLFFPGSKSGAVFVPETQAKGK